MGTRALVLWPHLCVSEGGPLDGPHLIIPRLLIAQEMTRRLAFPDVGRVATKLALRDQLAEAWHGYTAEEAETGWVGLCSPPVVVALGGVLARLSKGAAKL